MAQSGMLWPVLLATLCTGLSADQAEPALSVDVIHSPSFTEDMANACSASVTGVQFRTVEIEGTEYTRTVLSYNDFLCMEAGAQLLDSGEFLACAREAKAEGYNVFYMDDQEQCYGTNQQVGGDADLCTAVEGHVVYRAAAAVAPYTKIVPALEEFSISDFKVAKSFVVNFFPSCYGFEYQLSDVDQILKTVENSEIITSDSVPISLCSDTTLILQTMVDGIANGAAKAAEFAMDQGIADVGTTCYYFSGNSVDFATAKSSCPDGSVLASPSDDTHKADLITYLQSDLPSPSGWWVDLTLQNRQWFFGDGVSTVGKDLGRATTFACARMDKEKMYDFNDKECTESFNFICQYN